MWSLRKEPKTQVGQDTGRKVDYALWPRFVDLAQETLTSTSTVTATETATATDTVTFSVAVITFFPNNQQFLINLAVEHMHHGWVHIRSTPLCVEQRQERILWSTYGSQKLKNLKRSRRISLS